MASLREGGNEPAGFLKTICKCEQPDINCLNCRALTDGSRCFRSCLATRTTARQATSEAAVRGGRAWHPHFVDLRLRLK
ncbi:hypothetical protein ANN_21113 [Periplaneta americana]|uniref:Uncharacterized protein n=1 Tax=Periplaneta americana TaxID=6978 RepID=A0ABQ8SEG7_PERAM|nr:hypothetical protein ANN_21113 [Periplaneta americana]